ncbi:hypothetical protein PybrP1_005734 [[Pythium] brassicae (nom. inval.)]|nr:hypothetical protein PybrP1_005734 [[Pythium] brassicae (nom. inval.)]
MAGGSRGNESLLESDQSRFAPACEGGKRQKVMAPSEAGSQRSAATTVERSDSDDLCRVLVVSDSCARERLCAECLSAAAVPARSDGCYLDAVAGVCRTFDHLPLTARTSADLNGSATPAANVGTFVPSAAELALMSPDQRVCFGAGGCVCVAACESVERMSYTSKRCLGEPGPALSATQGERSSFPSAQLLAFVIQTGFLFVRCVIEYFRRRQQRQQRAGSELQLIGWVAWHRELREMERRGELGFAGLDTPKPKPASESEESGLRTASGSVSSASMLMVMWAPRNAL